MKLTVAVLTAAAVLSSAPAFADKIDYRQNKQENRIYQGVRSGQLTRDEFKRLENEQARIRKMEANARRDGHVTRSERARIDHAQDHASRHIYREKHDGRSRWSHWWHNRPWWR